MPAVGRLVRQSADFPLELRCELRPLLSVALEEMSEVGVADGFGGSAESVLSVLARLDEVVERGHGALHIRGGLIVCHGSYLDASSSASESSASSASILITVSAS